jgi:hypothetical protein
MDRTPCRYEDIITFPLEEFLGFDPRIAAELIRKLIDQPHEVPVEVLFRMAEEVPPKLSTSA